MKIISLLLLFASLGQAFEQIQPSVINQGITLGIQQQYDQALSIFSRIEQSNPKHPVGHFFKAATIQTQMLDLETRIYQDEFYKEIDLSIRLAKEALRQNRPDSLMIQFYYGAAMSYKSYQMGRETKYLAAFKLGLKSIKELFKVYHADSSFCDPLVGIGNYYYWTSRLTKMIN